MLCIASRSSFTSFLSSFTSRCNRWSSERNGESSLSDIAESRQRSTKSTLRAASAEPCSHELCRVATEVDQRSIPSPSSACCTGPPGAHTPTSLNFCQRLRLSESNAKSCSSIAEREQARPKGNETLRSTALPIRPLPIKKKLPN